MALIQWQPVGSMRFGWTALGLSAALIGGGMLAAAPLLLMESGAARWWGVLAASGVIIAAAAGLSRLRRMHQIRRQTMEPVLDSEGEMILTPMVESGGQPDKDQDKQDLQRGILGVLMVLTTLIIFLYFGYLQHEGLLAMIEKASQEEKKRFEELEERMTRMVRSSAMDNKMVALGLASRSRPALEQPVFQVAGVTPPVKPQTEQPVSPVGTHSPVPQPVQTAMGNHVVAPPVQQIAPVMVANPVMPVAGQPVLQTPPAVANQNNRKKPIQPPPAKSVENKPPQTAPKNAMPAVQVADASSSLPTEVMARRREILEGLPSGAFTEDLPTVERRPSRRAESGGDSDRAAMLRALSVMETDMNEFSLRMQRR